MGFLRKIIWIILFALLLTACRHRTSIYGTVPTENGEQIEATSATKETEDTPGTEATESTRETDPPAPGTLTDPDNITQGDHTMVGTTYTLSAEAIWKLNQFQRQNSSYTGDYDCLVLYVYNPVSKSHRIAVITDSDSNNAVSRFAVYTPDWKDPTDFFAVLKDSFQAEMTSRTNITSQESMYLYTAANPFDVSSFYPQELRTPENFSLADTGTDVQYYFCRISSQEHTESHWHSITDKLDIAVIANTETNCSTGFKTILDVLSGIIDRFSLHDELGIEIE